MKATRKPLTAECYKYTGDDKALKAWLKSLGCSDISIVETQGTTSCGGVMHYKNITFRSIEITFGSFLLFDDDRYIIVAKDFCGKPIHAMTPQEFNHLYTIDEE